MSHLLTAKGIVCNPARQKINLRDNVSGMMPYISVHGEDVVRGRCDSIEKYSERSMVAVSNGNDLRVTEY